MIGVFCVWASAAAAQPIGDPTQPTRAALEAPVSVPSPWTLSATLIAAERRVATINGEVVGVGDRTAGAIVIEILPHAVRLRQEADGRVIELYMHAFRPALR